MKFKVFKIKEGKEQQWRDWCAVLNARKNEVLETLKEEVVREEACLYFGGYVLYYMDGGHAPATDKELNQMHRKQRTDCLEEVDLETLFDFKL